MEEVSAKEMMVCQGIVDGMSNAQAYLAVFPTCSSVESASSSANRMLKKVKVKEYLEKLKEELHDETVLSLQEKRKFLASVVRTPLDKVEIDSELCQEHTTKETKYGVDEVIKMPSKLEAIKIDNAMMGHNAPEKKELDVNLDTPMINLSVTDSAIQVDLL